MEFDPDSTTVQLCARGMEMEGRLDPEAARALFLEGWQRAVTAKEKFIAAHYLARHQESVSDKLHWDQLALSFALETGEEGMIQHFPSLYLNIAKCHEDLNEPENAMKHYKLALSYAASLADNGYGEMIKNGISKGIERIRACHY